MIKNLLNESLEMATKKIVTTGIVLIGGAVVTLSVLAVDEVAARFKYHRHIKKGLKDGSVVCIDGKYYNVIVDDQQ